MGSTYDLIRGSVLSLVEEEDRCGWMREGGDMQCIYSSGHPGQQHKWGPLPPWAFDDEEEYTDYLAWIQKMSQVPSNSRRKIQNKEVSGEK